jgi:hypothetical protein
MEKHMTKNELWRIYVKKNPSFEGDGNVTMSARGLKKLFDTTWDTAYYDGEEEYVEKTEQNFQQSSASINDLMSIFGMK